MTVALLLTALIGPTATPAMSSSAYLRKTGGTMTGNLTLCDSCVLSLGETAMADTGALRMPNLGAICWEASPEGTDTCISVNASELINLNGSVIVGTGDHGDSLSLRFANADGMSWEGNPTGTDATLTVNTSNVLVSSVAFTSSGAITTSNNFVMSDGQILRMEGSAGNSSIGHSSGVVQITDDGVVGLTVADGAIALSSHSTVTVNGATTFAATESYLILACDGPETINTITGGTQGQLLVIENTDTECTIANDDAPTAANAVNLSGALDDVGAAEKLIMLIHNGASWFQVGESDD